MSLRNELAVLKMIAYPDKVKLKKLQATANKIDSIKKPKFRQKYKPSLGHY